MPIAREVKSQILERVAGGDASVAQIARDHGVNPKTVYGWLERKALQQPNLVELNRLKREQAGLLQLIGKLTNELEKTKRGR